MLIILVILLNKIIYEMIALSIPFEDFNVKISAFSEVGNSLINTSSISTQDLEKLKVLVEEWKQKVLLYFDESFTEVPVFYKNQFLDVSAQFKIPGRTLPVNVQINRQKERIREYLFNLTVVIKMISVSDILIGKKNIDLEERRNYSIKQKMDFILNKLYELNDGNFYSISEILAGNGVILRHNNEGREILEALENNRYIERHPAGGSLHAKLTLQGAMLIEESKESYQENYSDINQTPQQLQDIIDELRIELNKLGIGHEIIFEELQELKSLYTTLNKKSWGQLLKGKLIDLALGKIVDNATIGFIYKAITHHDLHLL